MFNVHILTREKYCNTKTPKSQYYLGGGGGGYSVWKRVPTAVQLLESRGCREPQWLKKGGCPYIILYDRGAVRVSSANISCQIIIVCIQICSPSLNNSKVKYYIFDTENSSFNVDFKGLSLGLHEKGGAVNLAGAKQGLSMAKKGGL